MAVLKYDSYISGNRLVLLVFLVQYLKAGEHFPVPYEGDILQNIDNGAFLIELKGMSGVI